MSLGSCIVTGNGVTGHRAGDLGWSGYMANAFVTVVNALIKA